MPTYEYECVECGAVVEIVQPITAKPLRRLRKADPKPCDCGAAVRRRIGTGAGVIFKGSGFYETDYRSDSYTKAAKADQEAASKGTDSPEKGASSGKPAPTDKKDTKSPPKTAPVTNTKNKPD